MKTAGPAARFTWAALACATAAACGRSAGPEGAAADGVHSAPSAAAASMVVAPLTNMTRAQLAAAANDAVAVAQRHAAAARAGIGGACTPGDWLWSLRRGIARGKTWWRVAAPRGAEVLLGPVRPVAEGGGVLGALDAALAVGDCETARAQAYQVEQALRLIEVELGHRSLGERHAARALADAALELGALISESSAEVSTTERGVLADIEGLLDGIADGAAALAASAAPRAGEGARAAEHLAAVERRLAVVRHAVASASPSGLTGRALLVLETGYLGVELRSLAAAAGHAVPPPFAPRVRSVGVGGEPISVLTVPAPKIALDERRVALGRRLFHDARLSADATRACSSCHDPRRAFTDGLAAPASRDPRTPILRNTPTLLYAAAQSAFLWDGRVTTADGQALRVIHATAEMGVSDEELVRRLRADTKYPGDFARAFDDGLTAGNVARALAAFEDAELVPADAPVDRFARGDRGALDARMLAGFDVFVGRGRCARCHVPPLFGGVRPADFAVTVYATLGVTRRPDGKELDEDRGRALITGQAADERAFRTPHLRNVARTAPYFHHGGFGTLEAVVDFYVRGGGRGFGHDVPNQDPDVRRLDLTHAERADLVAFLRTALSDSARK